jgi:hypothetical protein
MDMLLREWKAWDEQISQVEEEIVKRVSQPDPGEVLSATQILVRRQRVFRFSDN